MKKDKQISFYKKTNRFINLHSSGLKHGLFDIILWKIGLLKDKKKVFDKYAPLNITPQSSYDKNKPVATWINHSCFFVQVNGINFLTDPVWSRKCSPFRFFGPSRLHAPPVKLKDLPKIDYVIISHNHYDHLDRKTVKELNKLYPDINWIVPMGLKKWFNKISINNVYELAWWQSISMGSVCITAVPAQHFSGRYIFDYNKSLWAGFVVEEKTTDKKFYFAGDTAYNEYDFKEIGNKFTNIDLAMIPIGAYIPRAFTKPIHVDPSESVKIHQDINPKKSIAMHWKTFKLSDEPQDLPPHDLYLALKEADIDLNKFIAVEPGTHVNW